MARILVIEDEEAIATALVENLEFDGHEVLSASDGQAGLELARSGRLDLILLDIMLPGLNGYEICRQLRREGSRVAIIVLSAKGQEADKVRGLDLGADDYVTKPVGVLELMARINAVLRRTAPAEDSPEPKQVLVLGRARIDFGRHEAFVDGQPVHLSPKEYGVLRLLWQRCGRVVTRAEILQQVWGYDVYPTTRTVDTHIAELRARLEEAPAHPRHILTVHGSGYRLNL